MQELYLTLNKSSNVEYYPFDINDEDYITTKFNRIEQFMDITQICIYYKNNKKDFFKVYFKNEDEDINSNQIVKKDTNGDLKIMIKSC